MFLVEPEFCSGVFRGFPEKRVDFPRTGFSLSQGGAIGTARFRCGNVHRQRQERNFFYEKRMQSERNNPFRGLSEEENLPAEGRVVFPANGNSFAADDPFDFSRGFPGQLILLYRKYGASESERHLTTRAIPLLMKQPKGFLSEYLPALSVFAGKPPLREAVRKCMRHYPRTGDWPGIRVPARLDRVLWNETLRISFRQWRKRNIRSA